MAHPKGHHLPSPHRVALTIVIPGGKAEMLKTRTRIVLLNLARIAAGLRASLSPWPCREKILECNLDARYASGCREIEQYNASPMVRQGFLYAVEPRAFHVGYRGAYGSVA